MRRHLYLLAALLGLAHAAPVAAQRLLWEQGFAPANAAGNESAGNVTLLGNQQFLLTGGRPVSVSGPLCQASGYPYFKKYTLSGALIRETRGRGSIDAGALDLTLDAAGVGWFTSRGYACVNTGTGTRRYTRALVQRITLAGDTGRAWYLAPAPPASRGMAILVQGNKIVTAGDVTPTGQPGQAQQAQLTCSDTLGRVRWQRNYPRLPSALDFASALVPTPRGGYLLSGDAYNFAATGYDHYVLETDSLGNFRRSRLLQPLGPGYSNGYRVSYQCNVLALPNGQGYLLSGTADSMRQFISYSKIGYVMRLDTALRVQWVYRHPAALSGIGTTSNYAYRLRLLPNNTVGLLLTDVRGAGTPGVSLAQVDIATGRRLGYYLLLSNTQSIVIPYDWQWVGDGTLLLCGKSSQAGVTYQQSYVARWDFRGTPLGTAGTAGAAAVRQGLALYPNPATESLTVGLPGAAAQPATVALFDNLGRCVRTQPATLGASATARLDLRGLPAGLYAVRVSTAGADYTGRVVVE